MSDLTKRDLCARLHIMVVRLTWQMAMPQSHIGAERFEIIRARTARVQKAFYEALKTLGAA